MNDYEQNLALARRFYAALVAKDWDGMHGMLHADASWSLPGNNAISGTAAGAQAVVDRARQIAGYGLKFDLEHILSSPTDVALGLHNTGERDGLRLDERLATVLRVRDGRIAAIETFLSDVPGMDAFFRR